jgi:hypothetical protein
MLFLLQRRGLLMPNFVEGVFLVSRILRNVYVVLPDEGCRVIASGFSINTRDVSFQGLRLKVQGSSSSNSNVKVGAEASLGFVSVRKLVEVKRFALRRGLWFRVLDRVERGVVDLTVKFIDDIKSAKLAKVLVAILEKLRIAGEGAVDRLVRTLGFSLAKKVSALAVGLGYVSACSWAVDVGFARFLAVMQLNGSGRGRL